MSKEKPMVVKKSWDEFRESGLLWWVNRSLHLLGWAIVVEVDDDGKVTGSYPARVRFRGFGLESEEEGFIKVTEHLKNNAAELLEESKE